MTQEEAIERARKLLALGESSNEHEAALAVARAQELLDRFEIALADVRKQIDDDPFIEGSWEMASKRRAAWKVDLAVQVAESNGCSIFFQGATATFCGRKRDVERASQLVELIAFEIDRIALLKAKGFGRSYANSFRLGATDAIKEALWSEAAALREELRGKVSESALVIVDTKKADAEAWRDSRHFCRPMRSATTNVDNSGYSAGHNQGAGIYGSASSTKITGSGNQITG